MKWTTIKKVLIIVPLCLSLIALYEWWANRNRGFTKEKVFGIKLPEPFRIHGIDVSSYQLRIDWGRVKTSRDGQHQISFAFIKASEGTGKIDSYFSRNWSQAHRHGIPAGAYHFFLPSQSGQAQAKHFIKLVPLKKGDLPPVVDIEQDLGVARQNLRKELKLFLQEVEKAYSVKPILYTNVKFYNQYLGDGFEEFPLWVAHYIDRGRPRIGRNWTFWQHSENGNNVPGISVRVDFNVFNGDSLAFQRLRLP